MSARLKGENVMKKLISVALAVLIMLTVITASAFAMTAPEEWLASYGERIKTTGKILVTPGKNETELNFTWFSGACKETLKYAPAYNGAETVTAAVKSTVSVGSGYKHTAKLSGLTAGEYTYSFTSDGTEYGEKTFTVANTDGDCTVMYCSDPQLGRSGEKNSDTSIANDAYGWEKTVTEAVGRGAGLIVCGGDQINEGFSQKQMNVFLSTDKLDSVPFAGVAGNHDFYSPLYARYYASMGVPGAGNDRYFMHGNALFIIIDSNNIGAPSHEVTVKKAVESNPDAKWRIVVMHHSPYSVDKDEFSNGAAGKVLTPLFDAYQIDLVLSGHDHFYARTPATKDGKADADGTVYLQAGSASGGKCGHFSADGKDYLEFAYDVASGDASYSMLTFGGDALTVESYITGSETPFDTFTLTARTERNESPSWCFFSKIIALFVTIINSFKSLFM